MQPHGIMWSALSQYQTGKIGSRDILYTMRERANKLKKFCQHSGLADAWTSSFNSRCTDIYSHVFVKVNGNWIWLIFATQFSLNFPQITYVPHKTWHAHSQMIHLLTESLIYPHWHPNPHTKINRKPTLTPTHTHIHIHPHTHTHTNTHKQILTHTHMQICTYSQTHARTNRNSHTHIDTHAHIATHTNT